MFSVCLCLFVFGVQKYNLRLNMAIPKSNENAMAVLRVSLKMSNFA